MEKDRIMGSLNWQIWMYTWNCVKYSYNYGENSISILSQQQYTDIHKENCEIEIFSLFHI